MKKEEFGHLKPGNKFIWKRRLCVKDEFYCAVVISTGVIINDDRLKSTDLVTPVKVTIKAK